MNQILLSFLLLFYVCHLSIGLSETKKKRRQGEPIGPRSPTKNDSVIGLQNDYPNYDVDNYAPIRYRPQVQTRQSNFGGPVGRQHPQLVNIPEYTSGSQTVNPWLENETPKVTNGPIVAAGGEALRRNGFVAGLPRARTSSYSSIGGTAPVARTNPWVSSVATFANAFRSAVSQPPSTNAQQSFLGPQARGPAAAYSPQQAPGEFVVPINQDYDISYGNANQQMPMGGGYMGVARQNGGYGYSYRSYIERQSRRYPVMIYTLVQCVPCNRAKHLLATTYPDVPSHYLELVGVEDWQRQLQADLHQMTGQVTFPYIFVCGDFIGGASNLFEMHKSGQLRQVLNNCMPRKE